MRIAPPIAGLLLGALAACATSAAPDATGRPAASSETAAAPAIDEVAGSAEHLARRDVARPPQPELVPSYETALLDDRCADRDLAAPAAVDPALTILDRTYGLPPDYAPADLVPAAEAGFIGASGSRLIRAGVVDDLAALRAAAAEAGHQLVLESGYRSYADQATTFELWAERLGNAAALLRSARPGHSEHQLGTALDVTSPGWSGRFGDWAVESAEGAWLAEHAWRYGFVMSYPAGQQEQTCFGYEPWHYRWIGRDAAAAQAESGMVLRDFLERFIAPPEPAE